MYFFPNLKMTDDELKGIKEQAEMALETATKLLHSDLPPADYESQRDNCQEQQSAVKSIIDYYEDLMDAKRKQKRKLDDEIADLKTAQRPFNALNEDLKNIGKRHNNAFWDAKRGLSNNNIHG